MACGNCGCLYPAEQASFGEQAERGAIPFMDRRGWTIGAGALGSLVVLGSVAAATDSGQNEAFLAAPHVGDVYEVNTANLMTEPDSPTMYSAMRVVEVQRGDITLQMGKTYFEDLGGVQQDVREGLVLNADYYMADKFVFPRADLQAYYQNSTIVDVER